MIVKKNLSFHQIIAITWKIDLAMLAFCSILYIIDTYFSPKFVLPIAFPTLMGTAIAFFIGFNNTHAYGRWWEARIIWGGLTNDSRSWARSLLAYSTNMALNQKMIRRQIAFLYALTNLLRRDASDSYLSYLSAEDIASIGSDGHLPNMILSLQANDLAELLRSDAIGNFEFNSLNLLLQNFCDGMGKSERINNTYFPVTYAYFTSLFIWLFIALITMSTASIVGLPSIILGWLMGFVFNVIHLNGMSLVNPFELTPSTIPIATITRNIEINLLQMLKEKDIPAPLEPLYNLYSI
jgi:putative membrane protein